jgi:hypothetical protein
MWKANGKTTTLLLFRDSLFPKTQIYARCFLWRQNKPDVNYSPIRASEGKGGSVSRGNIKQQAQQQEVLQRKEEEVSHIQNLNMEFKSLESRRQIGKF